jgi:hypothetical protein
MRWPLSSTATHTKSSRNPPQSDVDIKRLMYRALMLRGMACSALELQSGTLPQQAAFSPLPCEKAREFAQNVFSRSAVGSDVQSTLDQDLQNFARAQVSA